MADSQDVTGDSGVQLTHYGYIDDPTPDPNSARGIGDRDNHLINGLSVALTQPERLHLFGTTGKSTGKEFQYGGKTYRDDDTAPESNRRIDIYDPGGREGSDPLATRYGIWEPARGNMESPLQQFRQAYPEYRLYSDDAILENLQAAIAPELEKDDFDAMARKDGGAIEIKNALNQPLIRFRRSLGPDGKDKSDDQLVETLYNTGVKLGKLDPNIESLEDYKATLIPPKDWVAQAYRFTKEVVNQVWPQTQETGLTLVEGAHQMQSAEAATNTLHDIFTQVYPGRDVSNLIAEYQKLSPDQREQKLAQDAGNNQQLTQDLMNAGTDVTSLTGRMGAAFSDLDVKGQNQQAIDWAQRTIGQIDRDKPGFLPENQEKVAKLVAQMPSQVLLSIFPGLREGSNYVQLYKYNSDAISKANPGMDPQEVDRRARAGADAQFPAQELMSLVFLKGGALFRGSMTNTVLKSASKFLGSTAESVGVGAGTMTVNQIIQNLESNRPLDENVKEAAQSGVVMGMTGRVLGMGANLSTGLLKHWISTVAELRKATGVSEQVSSLEPKDINRYVNGGPNPVEQTAQRNAVDIIVDAGEKLVESHKTPESVPNSPSVEAFEKAIEARESGDLNSARAFADQGMAIASQEEKQVLNQGVADTLKVITGKEKIPRGTKEEEEKPIYGDWTELQPWQSRLDIPPGAQTRTDLATGTTSYRTVTRVPRPEAATRYLGVNQAPVESATKPEVSQKSLSDPGKTKLKAGAIQTRSDGKADLYLENGVALTFDDVEGALSARSTLRKGRGRPWEARTSGKPGVQPQVSQTPGGMPVEPPPGIGGKETLPQEPEGQTDLESQLEASIQARKKPPETTEGLGAIYNPLTGMREAKRMIGDIPGWRDFERGFNRMLAPERLGEEAEKTAAIGKGLNAQEKVGMVSAMRVIAESEQLNRFLDHSVESTRRENWWRNKSDSDLKHLLTNVSNHVSNGSVADKLFDYYGKVLKYQIDRANRAGVKPGYIQSYFSRAFRDPEKAKVWFGQQQNKFPTFQDAVAAGLVPKTFNPERNLIAYSATLVQGIKEVEMMEEMIQEGLAVRDDKAGKQVADANGWGSHYIAANKKNYLLSDQSVAVVSNIFKTDALFASLASLPTKWAGALKGMSSVKLSWSFFHPLHMSMVQVAETATELEARLGKGLARPEDFKEAFRSIMDISVGAMLPGPSVQRYGRLVDAMTGRGDPTKLSAQAKTDYRDLLEMGIVPSVSHEREIAWANWLTQQSSKFGAVSNAAKLGYSWLIGEPIQKWMFGKVIPSLKVAAALRRRDTLLRYYGNNLRDPSMTMTRRLEYQKINRDVEGRFGEMFYDNLLWNRAAKQFGVSIPLSMGWTLGFWRVHGDAIVDLTNNALNMDKIASGVYKNKELVTNRMLYAANLYAMSMLSAGLATYALTGSINGVRDLFFPRIGKDKNGNDERVRTPFWAGEAYSLIHETLEKGLGETATRYASNKLNPGLQALWQVYNNQDYKGQAITDDTNPQLQQWAEKTGFLIQQMFEPITVETVTGPAGQTKEGFMAGLIGFGPAATWTHRTPFENTVMSTENQRKAKPVTEAPKPGDVQAHQHFKHLDAEHQVHLMEEASPDEFNEYYRIASKKARALWHEKHPNQ